MMFADFLNVELDLIGEVYLVEQIPQTLCRRGRVVGRLVGGFVSTNEKCRVSCEKIWPILASPTHNECTAEHMVAGLHPSFAGTEAPVSCVCATVSACSSAIVLRFRSRLNQAVALPRLCGCRTQRWRTLSTASD